MSRWIKKGRERAEVAHLEFVQYCKRRGLLRHMLYPIEQAARHVRAVAIARGWKDRVKA